MANRAIMAFIHSGLNIDFICQVNKCSSYFISCTRSFKHYANSFFLSFTLNQYAFFFTGTWNVKNVAGSFYVKVLIEQLTNLLALLRIHHHVCH